MTTKKDEESDALGDDMTHSDPPDTGGDDVLSLEERLKRLEEIVRSLEAADLDMDAALGLFGEGVKHVRGAEATLRVAELKVEELLGPEEDAVLRPLDERPE